MSDANGDPDDLTEVSDDPNDLLRDRPAVGIPETAVWLSLVLDYTVFVGQVRTVVIDNDLGAKIGNVWVLGFDDIEFLLDAFSADESEGEESDDDGDAEDGDAEDTEADDEDFE